MSDRNFEQRIIIKFLMKLGKNGSETLEMLKTVYGDDTMSQTRVYEWHKRFREGREDAHDDKKSGRPRTSATNDNVKKIRELLLQDRQMSIRQIAEQLNINKETVRSILNKKLGVKKVSKHKSKYELHHKLKNKVSYNSTDFTDEMHANS